VTGCSRTDSRTELNASVDCNSSGYNNGNYSGARICACR
jgi:hypothetical protein